MCSVCVQVKSRTYVHFVRKRSASRQTSSHTLANTAALNHLRVTRVVTCSSVRSIFVVTRSHPARLRHHPSFECLLNDVTDTCSMTSIPVLFIYLLYSLATKVFQIINCAFYLCLFTILI